MAKISTIIPEQRFEVVRDRIAEILADELANQYVLSNEEVLKADAWIERFVQFDHTELPALNISLSGGEYSNKDVRQVDGVYTYFIDCAAAAPSSDDHDGDHLANVLLHRLIGVVRTILEHPAYSSLGIERPFNCAAAVSSLSIGDPRGDQDAESIVSGRLVYTVRIPETIPLPQPVPLRFSTTAVKLSRTPKGFVYRSPTKSPILRRVVTTESDQVIVTGDGFAIAIKRPASITTSAGHLLTNQSGQKLTI